MERLVQAGIFTDRRVGRARLLRAGDSALIGPLANLLLLGYGPKPALERALTDVPGIEQAFIGGSWAARYQGQAGAFPHDVDVIVVGTPNRDDVAEAVSEATGVDAIKALIAADNLQNVAPSPPPTSRSSNCPRRPDLHRRHVRPRPRAARRRSRRRGARDD